MSSTLSGVGVCALSMSAKMFKCTPEQLPADLKANLLAMLQCGVNALEGYIRPGCVHLTLHAMLGPDAGAALQGMGVRALVNNLVAASDHTLWRSETLLVRPSVSPSRSAAAPCCCISEEPGPAQYDGWTSTCRSFRAAPSLDFSCKLTKGSVAAKR